MEASWQSTLCLVAIAASALLAQATVRAESAAATYFTTNKRCPTAQSLFSSHSAVASNQSECGLSCLLLGNCSVYSITTAATGFGPCLQANLGQVLATWQPSSNCTSKFRSELFASNIVGFWDFRLSPANLLTDEGLGGSFQLNGSCAISASDGLVMTGDSSPPYSSGFALLPGIAGTPFGAWQNFSATNASLFMRVRRQPGRANGYFAVHTCGQTHRVAVALWETAEGILTADQAPDPASSGASYRRWTDQLPRERSFSEWTTLGFVYTAGSSGSSADSFSVWEPGHRTGATAVLSLDAVNLPQLPLCVSLGAAAGQSLQGSIRCMLVSQFAVSKETVTTAFIGC